MSDTCYSCQIFIKLELSQQIFKKYSISNFMKIHPVGAWTFNVDGQTDMMKLTVLFHNFMNTPKKQHFNVLYMAF